MTPGQYIALARDIGIVAGLALILWFVYRGGEDRVKASDLKGLQAEIQQQAKTVAQWRKESTDANDQLSKDVSAINAAHDIPVQHIWVRDTACAQPAVLSPATSKASPQPAPAGGIEPGRGDAATADRRDFAVAEFKRKWETTLAECRALDAQWPQ
jgi:type II secretory pathway pseudopilin PulG